VDIADISAKVERLVREFDHSHQTSGKVKDAWCCISSLPYASIAYTGTIQPLVIYMHPVS
jgi:hypothetical protein